MPGNSTKKKVAVVLGAVLLSAGMIGCKRTQTTEELLADAKQYQQKGDHKAAFIQLKNAVANNPDNAEARLQLGIEHLKFGDAVSAEKELRKAASLGTPADKILPLLAQSLLTQNKFQPLLDDVTEEKAKGSALLMARRGDAFLGLGDKDKALDTYKAALALDPNSGDGLIGIARHAAMSNDLAGAERYAAEASSRAPNNAEVWMIVGNLARLNSKKREALAAYDKVLAIDPAHRSANVEKAMIHIAAKEFDLAKGALDAARKYNPADLSITYAQALLNFNTGKNKEARDSLQKILKVAPQHMPSILLSGAVELNLGNTQQAEQLLSGYLTSNPNNSYARKLLAQAMLKQGRPADATTVLAPALKDAGKDAQMLALAGQSYLQMRDFGKASTYLEQASTLAPGVADIRTSLGLSKLGQGDWNNGVEALQQATTIDPKSLSAGFALIQAELGHGDYDKALAAAQNLEKAQPDNPAVHNMKGQIYLSKKDTKNARAGFEKAVSLQPTFIPAVANLARLDMADKNPGAAKQRFEAVLAKDKKNIEAMSALAALEQAQGKSAEATTWLEKAQSENSDAVAPAITLGNHYLHLKQPEKAVALTRKLLVAHPSNPELLDLMGQAQVASKDLNGAVETYSKLAAVLPKSPAAQVRLAAAHAANKNESAAAQDLKRALAIDPNFTQAYVAQMALAMRSNKPDEALEVARQVQKNDPKTATGYVLEGDLMLSQNKIAPALAAYEKGFAISNSPQILAKMSQIMARNGKAAEAEARLVKFHTAYPGNDMIAMLVADNYLAKRQFKPAIASLEAALKANPSNPATLNNLAYAYQQENDARALPTAEKAYKLAGQNAAIMDTLGWILVQKGETARAADLLRKAVGLAPKAPEIRYHLAVALAKGGDKAGARKEVEESLAGGETFAAKDDAKALLKQL
jgi:putative PEP-CTERM system TPR-repeat lipoprotein